MNYTEFIDSKRRLAKPMGFECGPLPESLFDWQSDVVRWAVRRGRSALFAGCGLGKTVMQLAWAEQVYQQTGRPVMVHCPVGVRLQTIREAGKFHIAAPIHIANDKSEVQSGIVVANYEKLHRFDLGDFGGVVLDESSILKSIDGKTKARLIEGYSETPYRLCCTATPAPNDYDELGNHAEFLGIMEQSSMRSMFFTHDGGDTSKWRLRRHGEQDFWRWTASWAVCFDKPSDIGDYSDEGYQLPPCVRYDHIVEHHDAPSDGYLFHDTSVSATDIHRLKRSTVVQRAAKVRQLIEAEIEENWIVWCDTNYEADELRRQFSASPAMSPPSGGSIWREVRGSMPTKQKEDTLAEFSNGSFRVIVTKPEIAGFGMNWQHVARQAFVGMSYSFERYYQAVRRSLRFLQLRPVHIHVVGTEAEAAISEAVYSKEDEFARMQRSMVGNIQDYQSITALNERMRRKYVANSKMEIPQWMQSA